MRKFLLPLLITALILALLSGCVIRPEELPSEPDIPVIESEVPSPQPETPVPQPEIPETPEIEPEETPAEEPQADEFTHYSEIYAHQIQRYYTALSENWSLDKYFENELNPAIGDYGLDNPMDHIGYALEDLDRDGTPELIIGDIPGEGQQAVVFELWTLVEGEPFMLAQGAQRIVYQLHFKSEDNSYYISCRGSNGAANTAYYYYVVADGKLEIVEGIVFDALSSEAAPWFLTGDEDWDISNDEPIDEAQANAIMDSYAKSLFVPEYQPYSLYNK